MWLRCVCGLSLRAAMSSIIRRRSGLTVLVSLMGRSFLSEVERPSILRTGLPVAPSLIYRLATGLSAPAPAQRAGAQRLRALAHPARSAYARFLAFSARTGADREGQQWVDSGRLVADPALMNPLIFERFEFGRFLSIRPENKRTERACWHGPGSSAKVAIQNSHAVRLV